MIFRLESKMIISATNERPIFQKQLLAVGKNSIVPYWIGWLILCFLFTQIMLYIFEKNAISQQRESRNKTVYVNFSIRMYLFN